MFNNKYCDKNTNNSDVDPLGEMYFIQLWKRGHPMNNRSSTPPFSYSGCHISHLSKAYHLLSPTIQMCPFVLDFEFVFASAPVHQCIKLSIKFQKTFFPKGTFVKTMQLYTNPFCRGNCCYNLYLIYFVIQNNIFIKYFYEGSSLKVCRYEHNW